MRNPFKKRQNIFIKLIQEQARFTLEGLDALNAYMVDQNPAASALLRTKEKEAKSGGS